MRNLGRLGEAQVAMWAADAGLIVNKSADQDASGWDYFLEWQTPAGQQVEKGFITLDRAPAPLQALVQVKATEISPERLQVKLSNWRRMAVSPFPCFFLVLEFAKDGPLSDAYLVHVDKEQLRRVLMRLREEDLNGKTLDGLHKQKLDLRWNAEQRLPTLSGAALEAAIRAAIGTSMDAYVAEKTRNLKTLGYEEATVEMKATFKLPPGESRSAQDVLVDFALGLLPELEMEGAVVHDARFGMLSPEPIERLGPAKMMLAKLESLGEGTLLLRRSDTNETLALPAKAYGPSGLQRVLPPGGPLRIRYALPFVDVLFELGESGKALDIRFKLPDGKSEHALSEMRPAARMIEVFADAISGKASLELEILFEGARVGKASLESLAGIASPMREWARLVNQAWTVARVLEIESSTTVSVGELAAFRDHLLWMNNVLGPFSASARIAFTLAPEDSLDEDLEWCVPLVALLPLGGHIVQLSVAVIGKAKAIDAEEGEGRRLQLETQDIRRHRARVFKRGDASMPSRNEALKEVTALYEDKFNIVRLED